MKKWLSVLLTLCLLLPVAAMAEEATVVTEVTANAVAECENTYDLVAPFSGVVKPFSAEVGDTVKAGDVLFELDTMKVYAPTDGVVQGIFAEVGDLCENVMAQYGSLLAIEKTLPQVVEASTSGAYSDAENRLIHVGETVYFKQSNDSDNTGEGFVISVTGSNYLVEVTAGHFDVDDSVKLYRDEKMGTKTAIGSGTIERAAEALITGSGRVLTIAVRKGQTVQKGQLLFELASADAEQGTQSAQITANRDGALGVLRVASGQQVYKGQVLGTLYDLSAMRVVAEVDEMDLDRVHVGDTVSVVFDRYSEQRIAGTVREIARTGVQKQNATYYDVQIAFSSSAEVLPGMNATVYLPATQP